MNATESEHGGNKTEALMIPRVVGGVLEKQGGSPWQVCPQIPHYTASLISKCHLVHSVTDALKINELCGNKLHTVKERVFSGPAA